MIVFKLNNHIYINNFKRIIYIKYLRSNKIIIIISDLIKNNNLHDT